MNSNYYLVEIGRIILVLFIALVGAMLSHYWLLSLTIALSAYIFWLLYKLRQLHKWLKNGAKNKKIPDNNGLWEHITQKIQAIQKQSTQRKKRMAKLLKSSQRIISGLPYATIVLNKNNEIEWANKISETYFDMI